MRASIDQARKAWLDRSAYNTVIDVHDDPNSDIVFYILQNIDVSIVQWYVWHNLVTDQWAAVLRSSELYTYQNIGIRDSRRELCPRNEVVEILRQWNVDLSPLLFDEIPEIRQFAKEVINNEARPDESTPNLQDPL